MITLKKHKHEKFVIIVILIELFITTYVLGNLLIINKNGSLNNTKKVETERKRNAYSYAVSI